MNPRTVTVTGMPGISSLLTELGAMALSLGLRPVSHFQRVLVFEVSQEATGNWSGTVHLEVKSEKEVK